MLSHFLSQPPFVAILSRIRILGTTVGNSTTIISIDDNTQNHFPTSVVDDEGY